MPRGIIRAGRSRIEWDPIIAIAKEIVESYSYPISLRTLHYRLVEHPRAIYVNDQSAYNQLSRKTAEARRNATFPRLMDPGRGIDRPYAFNDPKHAKDYLLDIYRLPRASWQPKAIWLVVEKATLLPYLEDWFGEFSTPRVALRGYASNSLENEVIDDIARETSTILGRENRETVMLYIGDFDPSGWHLRELFAQRVAERGRKFDIIEWVAIRDLQQVEELHLHERYKYAKPDDARLSAFQERFGVDIQVEAEAIEPSRLQELLTEAFNRHWDPDRHHRILEIENAHTNFISRNWSVGELG